MAINRFVGAGYLASVRPLNGLQLAKSVLEHVSDFFAGHDVFEFPGVGVSHIHEFNEPQRDVPGRARFSKRNQFTLVQPFLDHGVDFDTEAEAKSDIDASEDLTGAVAGGVGHLLKQGLVDGIETHGYSVEACVLKG